MSNVIPFNPRPPSRREAPPAWSGIKIGRNILIIGPGPISATTEVERDDAKTLPKAVEHFSKNFFKDYPKGPTDDDDGPLVA